MNKETPIASNSSGIQIKITANSAFEAVKVIQQRFGENAKVLNVKQVEAQGLKRLVRRPRLEVIVEVNPGSPDSHKIPAESLQKEQNLEDSDASGSSMERNGGEEDSKPKGNPISRVYSRNQVEQAENRKDLSLSKQIEPCDSLNNDSVSSPRFAAVDSVKKAVPLLLSVGFDASIIERIRSEIDFNRVPKDSAMHLFSWICDWLRNRIPDSKSLGRGTRRAFIGTSGSGKTSALCKALAADVFVNGLEPIVMKVDSDVPNASDGLESFCEILGCPLIRSIEELDTRFSSDRPLYVDMPGFKLGNEAGARQCKDLLDRIGADERILVVNAAYDSDLIAATYEVAATMDASRVVFTHLDEAARVGKLWKFLLHRKISPLFFSHGTNPAGDYDLDPFSYLLDRTFPRDDSRVSSKRDPSTEELEFVQSEKEAVASV